MTTFSELVPVLGQLASQLASGGLVQVASAPVDVERELVLGALELLPGKRTVVVEEAGVLAGVEEGLPHASYFDFAERPYSLADAFQAFVGSRPDLVVVRDDGKPATSLAVAEQTTRGAVLFLTRTDRLLGEKGLVYAYEPPPPEVGPIGPRSRPSPLA